MLSNDLLLGSTHLFSFRSFLKGPKTKRKSYTLDDKLTCLKLLDKNKGVIRKTAKEFGCTPKMIRSWKKQRQELESVDRPRSKRRIGNLGRSPKYFEKEHEILNWFINERKENRCVNYRTIREKAKLIIESDEFKGSCSWISGFMKRHSLTMYVKPLV